MDYSNIFVCLMGMGTVFLGLVCLIILTELMSRICGCQKRAADRDQAAGAVRGTALPSHGAGPSNQEIAAMTAAVIASLEPDHPGELVAAVSAAIAEGLDDSVAGIRIVSMRKV